MCATCQCTHESLKTDLSRWITLPLVGRMSDVDDDGKIETIEIRNAACGASLSVEVAS